MIMISFQKNLYWYHSDCVSLYRFSLFIRIFFLNDTTMRRRKKEKRKIIRVRIARVRIRTFSSNGTTVVLLVLVPAASPLCFYLRYCVTISSPVQYQYLVLLFDTPTRPYFDRDINTTCTSTSTSTARRSFTGVLVEVQRSRWYPVEAVERHYRDLKKPMEIDDLRHSSISLNDREWK